ncbi:UNVERIFIED_CONTAM: hypothetical protein GTU68_061308 [Idotea baltica]|nr:hypothetical protein [Idotea baltica]
MNEKNKITVPSIVSKKNKELITALTAYDYTFAKLLDGKVDIILVGDSLGTIIQGNETTVPVDLDEIIYHSKCVRKGVSSSLVVADLPFMSYQISPEEALRSAGRVMKEAGVNAVKLEGGVYMAETIKRITNIDIPVMGHVGLTPQSYHRMGGHKIQGDCIIADALAVQHSGAFAIVLEGIPEDLAEEITSKLDIPTIGIAAGNVTDGQILVTHDLLGLGRVPKFVKKYADLNSVINNSINEYKSDLEKDFEPKYREPNLTIAKKKS